MRIASIEPVATDGRAAIRFTVEITAPVVFEPRIRARIGGLVSESSTSRHLPWLPRGTYRFDLVLPREVVAGTVRVEAEAIHRAAMQEAIPHRTANDVRITTAGGADAPSWSIESQAPAPPLASLSWSKGHADWFFRHFDHAALTVKSYMLGDSPLLRGRILDVGCGDGITDLGLALRTGCKELIGIDPFRGYERLAEVATANHLPADAMPGNLRFLPADANALPFDDDAFDVLVSWGSVEHIAGGYAKALAEMRRVLKPDGLLFIHPGLYYSNWGHHLGEFSSEPHFHLKRPPEEIRRIVHEAPMNRLDRSGHVATREEYWQWYQELNRITVAGFEQELRALGFQPWRVALRTEPLIEYSPEIYHFPMQDLATGEVYISCLNHKARR